MIEWYDAEEEIIEQRKKDLKELRVSIELLKSIFWLNSKTEGFEAFFNILENIVSLLEQIPLNLPD